MRVMISYENAGANEERQGDACWVFDEQLSGDKRDLHPP